MTYRADPAQNVDQTVTITCEVTLPGNPNPTVSAPSLTAMTELGITGQLVSMLINVERSGADFFDRNNPTVDAGSDSELDTGIAINRIRFSSTNRFILNRSGSGSYNSFWDSAARSAYSFYVITNNGTVLELPGSWIQTGSGIGSGYMRLQVPSSETTIINALNAIATGETMVFGIADTDSVGIPDETASTWNLLAAQ